MKSFFEEYGFVILAAIVVILLIAMCTPIGNLVKSQITGIVDSFANKTNTKLNAVDAGENTAYLRKTVEDNKEVINLDVSSGNSTDTFSYKVHYVAGGKTMTYAKQNSSEKAIEGDGANADYIAFEHTEGDSKVSTAGSIKLTEIAIDKGSTVQVEVKNNGTGEIFYSNSIVTSEAHS